MPVAAGPLTASCLAWAQTRFHSVQCCRSSISTTSTTGVLATTSISTITTTTRTTGVLVTTRTTSTIACAVYLLA